MNRRQVHADIARIEALVRPIHPMLITLFITFWQNYCKTLANDLTGQGNND